MLTSVASPAAACPHAASVTPFWLVGQIPAGGVPAARYLASPDGELLGRSRTGSSPALASSAANRVGLPMPGRRGQLALPDLPLDLGQPVAAVAGPLDLQARLLLAQPSERRFELGPRRLRRSRSALIPSSSAVGQFGLQVGKVVPQRGPPRAERREVPPGPRRAASQSFSSGGAARAAP